MLKLLLKSLKKNEWARNRFNNLEYDKRKRLPPCSIILVKMFLQKVQSLNEVFQ